MGRNISPRVVTDGLVFYIDFANPKSVTGNVVNDMCPRNITVTLTNASNNTLVVANGYAEFSPASESTQSTYYNIANTYFNDIRNEQTVECCVWSSSYPSGGNRLVSSRITETGQPLGYNMGAASIGTEVNSGGTWRTTSYGIQNTYNTWVHVTQTTSNTANVMITYVNGANVGATSIPGTLANGGGFLVGKGFYGGDRYSAGRVSFLKVYSRALTPEEIKQNFNALRGRFGI